MALTLNNLPAYLAEVNKLSDADKLAFSQVIWKHYQKGSNILDIVGLDTGVQCNTPIPLGNRDTSWTSMGSTAGLASQCDPLPEDVSVSLSTKLWNPVPYKATHEMCLKDLECVFKDFMNSEKCQESDLRDTPFMAFLVELITERLVNSHWTKTFFADTASGSIYLNGHDGIFKQMLAVATVGNAQRIDLSGQNGQATIALQNTLAPTVGYDTFNAMYEAWEDNEALRGRRDLKIYTTRKLASNYMQQLRTDKQLNCCERDTTGNIYNIDNLNIFGMKIQVVDEWDQIITKVSDFTVAGAYDNPHRAIICGQDNMRIGTCEATSLGNFDIKYDDYNEMTKIEPEYTFDSKVIQDEEFIIAI